MIIVGKLSLIFSFLSKYYAAFLESKRVYFKIDGLLSYKNCADKK
jgi:hypothetical protein